jgi:hypothetical protein
MRTLKLTVIPENRGGIGFQISTECVVQDEEEATEEGREAWKIIMAFMNGFGETDDD